MPACSRRQGSCFVNTDGLQSPQSAFSHTGTCGGCREVGALLGCAHRQQELQKEECSCRHQPLVNRGTTRGSTQDESRVCFSCPSANHPPSGAAPSFGQYARSRAPSTDVQVIPFGAAHRAAGSSRAHCATPWEREPAGTFLTRLPLVCVCLHARPLQHIIAGAS
jgi:hypothetical protein